MKECIGAALLALCLLFGLPWLTAAKAQAGGELPPSQSAQPGQTDQTAQAVDASVTLRVWDGEKVQQMTMAEYLPGVVRGEMPASFEEEALKAQAVAERTYILYEMRGGPKSTHPDADVCMDYHCCSAYVSAEKAAANWGDKAGANEEKIQQAVRETDGYVALYDNVPILAVFHSSSAGKTESSGDVWSRDLPYLAPVESPENADNVPNYYSTASLPAQEFRTKFLTAHPEAKFSGDVSSWITGLTKNSSDRVSAVTVGGVTVDGVEMRTLYGLRSASFTVEASGDTVVFHVTGYGHGVGMSQYGANTMAAEGATWQEILQRYYTGITLTVWSPG
jgi:stage II sporulation protein D